MKFPIRAKPRIDDPASVLPHEIRVVAAVDNDNLGHDAEPRGNAGAVMTGRLYGLTRAHPAAHIFMLSGRKELNNRELVFVRRHHCDVALMKSTVRHKLI
jgi:hypothetical protein